MKFTPLVLAGVAAATAIDRRQTCRGQSCKVAAIAGSSGVGVTINDAPTGDTARGDCCVVGYRPELAPLAIQFRPELKQTCPKNFVGVVPSNNTVYRPEGRTKRASEEFSYTIRSDSTTVADIEARDDLIEHRHIMQYIEARAAAAELGVPFFEETAELAEPEPIEKRQGCKSKILIYAKGTFEPGALGVTIGPKLQTALGDSWEVRGVNYQPSVAGDYCLGRPGGVAATTLIEQTVKQCPGSLIALAGYSQGAMVVRNGLGYSKVQNKIKGILTYGDPFNGAPVYRYNGQIKTFCAAGDGVCGGQFEISGAHLSYGMSVNAGAAFLNSL